MDTQYYYFAASLPMISFESRLPLSVEEFLQDCRRLLQDHDYDLAENLLRQDAYHPRTQNPIFNSWVKFSRDFKNEEVFFRAQAAGKDPMAYMRGERSPDPAYSEILQQAHKSENPLEAQKTLDRFRWHRLDEMEFGNVFNFGRILIFGLKLKILERYARIDSPVGEKIFEELEEADIPLSFAHQM